MTAAVAVAALTLSGLAQARVVGGVDVPEHAREGGHELRLHGAALQEQFWFDIYGIALYLAEAMPGADAASILESDGAKQLRLYILRNLPADQVRSALLGGFQRAAPAEFESLRPRINRMLAAIRSVPEGEEIIMTWVPGTGTILRTRSGTRMTIPGSDFARALFSIWLGPDTDTPHLREELLGN